MSTRIRGYRYCLQQLNKQVYPSIPLDFLSALNADTYEAVFSLKKPGIVRHGRIGPVEVK